MSSIISSTGIGSGLDINGIVSALTTAFGGPETNALAHRKTTLTAQVSAFGTFQSALSTFQATLTALQNPKTLAGRTATFANTDIATATATSSAVTGTYAVQVNNLASSASLASKAYASASLAVGTGALTLKLGGQSTTINVDSTNNTLGGIADAINAAIGNPGINASILTTADGARLVLSGTATGAANTITVTQSAGDGGLAALVYDPANSVTNLTQTQAPADASFSINGYVATSPSNVVSGVIGGVTLNLQQPTAANTPTTLTVGNDVAGAQTAVGTFVTALNGLKTAIKSLTSYDPSTGTAGALLGNQTLLSFQRQLSQILGQVNTSVANGPRTLTDLGITANQQGTYDTKSATLGNALNASIGSVSQLLGGTKGIATQLNALVNEYAQAGGLLDAVNHGLQAGLSDVAAKQAALAARLKIYSATLTQEYNAMDTAVALLKQSQTFLTAEFNFGSTSSGTSTSTSSGTGLGSGNLSTGSAASAAASSGSASTATGG
jgi:flagellar hook-associated protein 2